MAHEAEGEMSPHPMTDDRRTADDALQAAMECLRNRCEHQPTGYGKEYDDHRESAIRAYGDARVREVLERLRKTVPDIDDVLDEELAAFDPIEEEA